MMVAVTMQLTPVYPSPFFNAIATLILHVSLIINAMLNLYICGDPRNAIKRYCLRSVQSAEDTEMTGSQPVSRDRRGRLGTT
jgi:hypothetical protein